jgi:hypothetical protein
MKKVKLIVLNHTVSGFGIVNKEGTDGVYNYNRAVKSQGAGQFIDSEHKNTTIAKANYYKNGDKIDRIIKVSSQCVGHNIYGSVHNVLINEDATTFLAYAASKEGILRGYFRGKKGDDSAKKKGAVTITDVELDKDAMDNVAVSQIEAHGNSGAKTDNSLYYTETLGRTHYSGKIFIDVSELQVMSCSDTFDRQSIPTKLQPFFEKQLAANGIEFKKVPLKKKNDIQPESCYMFSYRTVNELVNYFITRLTKLLTRNSTSMVEHESVTAQFITDEGDHYDVKIVDGKLAEEFSVESQYEISDHEAALAAERAVREAIEATKNKEPKSSKKGKKATTQAETN